MPATSWRDVTRTSGVDAEIVGTRSWWADDSTPSWKLTPNAQKVVSPARSWVHQTVPPHDSTWRRVAPPLAIRGISPISRSAF